MKRIQLRTRRRGGAVVEMVFSLFVILPLAFYMVFLQDLVLYKLNNQEASIVGVWDFQVASYQETTDRKLSKVIDGISHNHRRMFFDHTSAYNSYDGAFDAALNEPGGDGKMGHHVAQGAHECWILPGAQLPTCYSDFADTNDADGLPVLGQAFSDRHNRGGVVICDSRLGVFNKFLPQKLFQEFTNADLMKQAKKDDSSGTLEGLHGGDIDKEDLFGTEGPSRSGDAAGGDTFLFPYVSAAVLVDTWALNYDNDEGAKEYLPNRGATDDAPLSAEPTAAKAPGYSHYPVGAQAGEDQDWSDFLGSPVGNSAKLHPFLDRVTTIYKQESIFRNLNDAHTWHKDMKDFLSFASTVDGHGDLLSSPPLHFKTGSEGTVEERKGEKAGYSSGWADDKQQGNSRQNGYMGESDN